MMHLKILVAATILLAAVTSSPVSGGRDAGIAAYHRNDYPAALKELIPDAQTGDAKAQYYMGLLYARGHGVGKDPAAAAAWFRKSADQGNPEAQFDLGHLYRSGSGVPQDDATAVIWWRKAADRGQTFAQSSLAEMYLDGKGVERDLVQAYKWTILAEPRTQQRRINWNSFEARSIARMMKPGELAKAQKLVKKWLNTRR
ncbi:MAG: sel1 repeat family protein [Alphaproteobacteria bacterium]|nr:sel1 repeat family protein [Alphaproteobacteria bacterium]